MCVLQSRVVRGEREAGQALNDKGEEHWRRKKGPRVEKKQKQRRGDGVETRRRTGWEEEEER